MNFLSEFERLGFDRANITALLLSKYGINLGAQPAPSEQPQPQANPWPQWKWDMARLPYLNKHEAAAAFAGLDLDIPGYLADDDAAVLNRHITIIERNIATGRLTAGREPGGQTQWIIYPEDLAQWCAAQGIDYPLPMLNPIPTTDAGLREELAKRSADIVTLKARITELERENERLRQTQSAATTPPSDYADLSKGKGARQEAAVLHWIAVKGMNPLAIPDGDKGSLKDLCEQSDETQALFEAKTAFDETWKRLRSVERVRMENHESWARKGAE